MDQLLSLPAEYLVFAGLILTVTLGLNLAFRYSSKLAPSVSAPIRKSAASLGTDRVITIVMIFVLTWKLSPAVFSFSTVITEPLALLYLPGGTGGTWLAIGIAGLYTGWSVWRLKTGKVKIPEQDKKSSPPPQITFRFIGLWFAALLVLGIPTIRIYQLASQGSFQQLDENYGPFLGMEAPDFALPLLLGPALPQVTQEPTMAASPELDDHRGTLVLSALRGRPVVLNFWATWCPPCRAEFPELVALSRQFGDSAPIIAVNLTNSEGSIEDVRRFVLGKDGQDIIHVLDLQGTIGSQYRARVVPTTVILDAQGMVRYRRSGAVSRDLIGGIIQQLVDESQSLAGNL